MTVTDRAPNRPVGTLGGEVVRWLFDTTHRADPYPLYRRLREDQPVHRTPFRTWVVTGYRDAAAALKDRDLSSRFTEAIGDPPAVLGGRSSPLPRAARRRMLAEMADYADPQALRRMATSYRLSRAGPPPADDPAGFARFANRTMLLSDPPDHTRLRRLLSRTFTTRLVDRLTARVEALVHELLAAAAGAGRLDLVDDFAAPLSTTVTCDLLGIPPADQPAVVRWSRDLNLALDPVHPSLDPRVAAAADQAVDAGTRYLHRLVEARRADPADDLVSRMIRAGDHDDATTDDDVVVMSALLLMAGQTNVNLVSNGLVALLRQPEAAARWLAEPAVADTAVDELLRFDGPAQTVTRRATQPTALGGRDIPRGDVVLVVVGAANRDPEAFDRPDELVLDRAPNHHLGLSAGIHYCPGASLARMMARWAVPAVLSRRPRLLEEQVRWRPSLAIRALDRAPVALG